MNAISSVYGISDEKLEEIIKESKIAEVTDDFEFYLHHIGRPSISGYGHWIMNAELTVGEQRMYLKKTTTNADFVDNWNSDDIDEIQGNLCSMLEQLLDHYYEEINKAIEEQDELED